MERVQISLVTNSIQVSFRTSSVSFS